MKRDKKLNLDYKWMIVGLCFLMVFTALGFCSSTKGLFVKPVTEALSIKRSMFSLNDSCRFITTAIINIFFGALIGKFGAKKLICAGFASLALSMVIYATASNIVLFCVGGCLLGIGLSWTTTTMVGSVITKWCSENRGTVMGAVLAANGIGGAVAMQIVSPIIASGAFGYRRAYLTIACVLLAVLALVAVFFKENPKNYTGEKVVIKKKRGRGQAWSGIEFSEAVKMPYFYGAAICIFFTGFVLQGVTGVSAPHMQDVGLSAAFVASALSIHALSLTFFKFMTGVLYDKKGLRTTITICSVTAIIVMILLAVMTASPSGKVIAFIYSLFSSLALPLETILLPIYAADLFGEKSFNKVLGIFVSVNTAGYALGAPTMNAFYDVLKTYTPGFFMGATIMLAVVISMQFIITKAHKIRREVEERESFNE